MKIQIDEQPPDPMQKYYNTPTPETDAMASTMFPDGSLWVQAEDARELERERDKALADLAFRRDKAARVFRFRWAGMLQGDMANKEERIHPTQKPVALYRWLLANYAAPGMRVLDTHLGSGSHAIAAHYAGVHLTACEIDAEYFDAAKARITRETAQTELFIHHND